MNPDQTLSQLIASAMAGIVAGIVSAIASVSYFQGSVKTSLRDHHRRLESIESTEPSVANGRITETLRAHDLRLTTLENDIRYEIRAIRTSMHDLRNEMMVVVKDAFERIAKDRREHP